MSNSLVETLKYIARKSSISSACDISKSALLQIEKNEPCYVLSTKAILYGLEIGKPRLNYWCLKFLESFIENQYISLLYNDVPKSDNSDVVSGLGKEKSSEPLYVVILSTFIRLLQNQPHTLPINALLLVIKIATLVVNSPLIEFSDHLIYQSMKIATDCCLLSPEWELQLLSHSLVAFLGKRSTSLVFNLEELSASKKLVTCTRPLSTISKQGHSENCNADLFDSPNSLSSSSVDHDDTGIDWTLSRSYDPFKATYTPLKWIGVTAPQYLSGNILRSFSFAPHRSESKTKIVEQYIDPHYSGIAPLELSETVESSSSSRIPECDNSMCRTSEYCFFSQNENDILNFPDNPKSNMFLSSDSAKDELLISVLPRKSVDSPQPEPSRSFRDSSKSEACLQCSSNRYDNSNSDKCDKTTAFSLHRSPSQLNYETNTFILEDELQNSSFHSAMKNSENILEKPLESMDCFPDVKLFPAPLHWWISLLKMSCSRAYYRGDIRSQDQMCETARIRYLGLHSLEVILSLLPEINSEQENSSASLFSIGISIVRLSLYSSIVVNCATIWPYLLSYAIRITGYLIQKCHRHLMPECRLLLNKIFFPLALSSHSSISQKISILKLIKNIWKNPCVFISLFVNDDCSEETLSDPNASDGIIHDMMYFLLRLYYICSIGLNCPSKGSLYHRFWVVSNLGSDFTEIECLRNDINPEVDEFLFHAGFLYYLFSEDFEKKADEIWKRKNQASHGEGKKLNESYSTPIDYLTTEQYMLLHDEVLQLFDILFATFLHWIQTRSMACELGAFSDEKSKKTTSVAPDSCKNPWFSLDPFHVLDHVSADQIDNFHLVDKNEGNSLPAVHMPCYSMKDPSCLKPLVGSDVSYSENYLAEWNSSDNLQGKPGNLASIVKDVIQPIASSKCKCLTNSSDLDNPGYGMNSIENSLCLNSSRLSVPSLIETLEASHTAGSSLNFLSFSECDHESKGLFGSQFEVNLLSKWSDLSNESTHHSNRQKVLYGISPLHCRPVQRGLTSKVPIVLYKEFHLHLALQNRKIIWQGLYYFNRDWKRGLNWLVERQYFILPLNPLDVARFLHTYRYVLSRKVLCQLFSTVCRDPESNAIMGSYMKLFSYKDIPLDIAFRDTTCRFVSWDAPFVFESMVWVRFLALFGDAYANQNETMITSEDAESLSTIIAHLYSSIHSKRCEINPMSLDFFINAVVGCLRVPPTDEILEEMYYRVSKKPWTLDGFGLTPEECDQLVHVNNTWWSNDMFDLKDSVSAASNSFLKYYDKTDSQQPVRENFSTSERNLESTKVLNSLASELSHSVDHSRNYLHCDDFSLDRNVPKNVYLIPNSSYAHDGILTQKILLSSKDCELFDSKWPDLYKICCEIRPSQNSEVTKYYKFMLAQIKGFERSLKFIVLNPCKQGFYRQSKFVESFRPFFQRFFTDLSVLFYFSSHNAVSKPQLDLITKIYYDFYELAKFYNFKTYLNDIQVNRTIETVSKQLGNHFLNHYNSATLLHFLYCS